MDSQRDRVLNSPNLKQTYAISIQEKKNYAVFLLIS